MKKRISVLSTLLVALIAGLIFGPTAYAQSLFAIKGELESESFEKNLALGGFTKIKTESKIEFEWNEEESKLTAVTKYEYEDYLGFIYSQTCSFEGTAFPEFQYATTDRNLWRVFYTGTATLVTSSGLNQTYALSGDFYIRDYFDDAPYVDYLSGNVGCAFNSTFVITEIE